MRVPLTGGGEDVQDKETNVERGHSTRPTTGGKAIRPLALPDVGENSASRKHDKEKQLQEFSKDDKFIEDYNGRVKRSQRKRTPNVRFQDYLLT